ncbi:MAG TPA: SxtJ family membrane protein [Pyrinomonadaceae bacterium]|nr:SxtJ family membrane protein [Pyrinomonadaceae bacterium]
MTKREKNSEVTKAQARKSVFIVAGVLLLLAAWNFYRGRMTVAEVLGGISILLILMAALVPTAARGFHVLWMKLAGVLGYVNSRVLLSLVFYLLFFPYNMLARLIGRDPLNRRKTRSESYWIPRKATRQSKEQFERLF